MDQDEKSYRSPQEKKALSYARDRRNVYGENDKASRKAIPARKAGENRKRRRKASQAIKATQGAADEVLDVVESSLRQDIERVGGWKKSPDAPLEEFLRLQARNRSWRTPDPSGDAD